MYGKLKTIAVCDDEGAFLGEMIVKLHEMVPGSEVKTYLSGEALLADAEQADLYFLDIQMDGLNGMDTAIRLREKNEDAIIVFLTWEKSFVFKAFDVAAFHYLLKPVDDRKLREVLLRAQEEKNRHSSQAEKSIFIKVKGKNILLKLSDVIYFENDVRKILVHTKNGEISYYGTMAELENEAGEDFFRCHRAYLINLNCVEEYDAQTLLLSNGDRVLIARGRYPGFVKQYMKFLRG